MIKQLYITAIIIAAAFTGAGMITANFIELRARDNTQASDYTPARNTGPFNLIKY